MSRVSLDLASVYLDRMSPRVWATDELGEMIFDATESGMAPRRALAEGKPAAVIDVSGKLARVACALYRLPDGWVVEAVDWALDFRRFGETAKEATDNARRDVDVLAALDDPVLGPKMENSLDDPRNDTVLARLIAEKVGQKHRMPINAAAGRGHTESLNAWAGASTEERNAKICHEAVAMVEADPTLTPKAAARRLAERYGLKVDNVYSNILSRSGTIPRLKEINDKHHSPP